MVVNDKKTPDMSDYGLFGPFDNFDDVNKYWYQVTEKGLEESIEQVKENLEDSDNSEGDTKIYQQDLEELTKELQDLRDFVDDYARCTERYKFDKQVLQQIQEDWHDYNSSLYSDWSSLQAFILDGAKHKNRESKKASIERFKLEIIKREEIERRIKKFLSE